MTAILTLTVDRSSISLSDLVIDSEGFSGDYTLLTYEEPDTSPRVATARSPYVHGELVTGYTLDTSTMVFGVRVEGVGTAGLETKVQALRRALCRQASFTITRVLDGETQVWSCQPAGMTRQGAVVKGDVDAHLAEYTITAPVYPIFGS